MTVKKTFFVIGAILYLVAFVIVLNVSASDLDDCCDNHGGIWVQDGKAVCGDGTPISDKCKEDVEIIVTARECGGWGIGIEGIGGRSKIFCLDCIYTVDLNGERNKERCIPVSELDANFDNGRFKIK